MGGTIAALLTSFREYLLPSGVAVVGTMIAMGGLAVAGLIVAMFFALPAIALAGAVVRPVETRFRSISTGLHAVILGSCWPMAGVCQYVLNSALTVHRPDRRLLSSNTDSPYTCQPFLRY